MEPLLAGDQRAVERPGQVNVAALLQRIELAPLLDGLGRSVRGGLTSGGRRAGGGWLHSPGVPTPSRLETVQGLTGYGARAITSAP